MAQTDFSYLPAASAAANDVVRLPWSVSVYADRAHVRDELRDDAAAAGFRIGQVGTFASLARDESQGLSEVVLLDCPEVDGAGLSALVQLDVQAARSGVQLVVSTSIGALDDVFGCLDQCGAHILVSPGRADRVLALGRVLARVSEIRLRELSDDDRLTLLRLTEQVSQIAERLDTLGMPTSPDGSVRGEEDAMFRFESRKPPFSGQEEDSSGRLIRATRPALPDPRLIRGIIRQRQLRARFFDGDLFADPAWDMLLDLTAARAEHTRVSVTSLCIASGVPPTTALRWIGQMIETGLLQRLEDETDRRRAFIALTEKAADCMARYFAGLGKGAAQLV